ncbi:MAG: hypothetical protein L0Y55_01745 [Anaerolineales bacterium]|nr:hypothetical protein [Anaerolineales bacterium]
MSPSTPKQTRLIVTLLVVIAGILMTMLVPLIVDSTINPIVTSQVARIAKFEAQGTPEGKMNAAVIRVIPWSISFLFPLWAVFSFIAGIALFALALPFYKGEAWTRGAVLFCLAFPSAGGAFMLIPWLNFMGTGAGFPPALSIMAIGLIPYFTVILAEKSDWLTKLANAAVFLMLGVAAAENFSNGHATFRVYVGHPQRPLIAPGINSMWFAFITLWITTIMLLIAIFQLGKRQVSGWYIGLIAGLATAVSSIVVHFVRSTTLDYLYGSLIGLAVVVLLLVPQIKQRVLAAPQA